MSPRRRIRFDHGTLLRARDLEAVLDAEARHRVLHVRAAHLTCGVALGFAVGVGRTARGAVVGPGFGYDRRGREVVSAQTVFVPAPSADGSYDLVATVDGFEWRALQSSPPSDGLALARFELKDGDLSDPDIALRRGARGPGGRLAGGTQMAQLQPTIAVDTSAAAFRRIPYYFATLADVDFQSWPLGPFLEVASPAKTGFELNLRAVARYSDWPKATWNVTVHWVGVEPPSPCGGLDPDTVAVADPLDLPDEYATFAAVPPTVEPVPD